MGEASRRGTYEERKKLSVEKKKEMVKAVLEELETPDKELSLEEKTERSKQRIRFTSFMAAVKQSGLSPKDFTRRLKRLNKNRV